MVTVVNSDTLRLVGGPIKSRRKVVAEDQWPFLNRVACPKITLGESLFCGKLEKLVSNHTVKFSKGTWHHVKIWERKSSSRGVMQLFHRIPEISFHVS